MTRMQSARLRSLDHRTVHADPRDLVAALDNLTALYPDPTRRPPEAAALHDRLAHDLNKET